MSSIQQLNHTQKHYDSNKPIISSHTSHTNVLAFYFPEQCQKPAYNGFNLTNRVILEQKKLDKGRIENYYCPAYLRMKIKNFTEINHQDLEASLNVVIHLTLNLRGLPPLIERNVRQKLRLDFNKHDTMQIKQSPEIILKQQQQNGLITYIIENQICVGMESGNIFWFPFGLLDLSLTISLQSIYMNGTILRGIIQNSTSVKESCQKLLIKNYMNLVLHRIIGLCDESKLLILEQNKKEFQDIQTQLNKPQPNIQTAKQKHLKLIHIMKNVPIKLQPDNLKELLPVFIDFLTINYQQNNNIANTEIKENEIDWISQLNLLKSIVTIEEEERRMQGLQDVYVKFNFMDCQQDQGKIEFSSAGSFGLYDLSESNLKADFTSDFVPPSAKKVQLAQKFIDYSILKPFSNSHFRIPIYKFPAATFTTIFVPLVLLGILNLSIYFQDTTLSNRLESLTNVMLAFIALIPVIRGELPFSSHLTMAEITIYSQTACCLLCFWQSMEVRGNQDYVFDWKKNPFFLINAIIEALVIFIPLFLLIKFYMYDIHINNYNIKRKKIKFDHQQWHNFQCDNAFSNKINNSKIKIIKVEQQQQAIKDILLKIIKQNDRQQEQNQHNQQDQDEQDNKNDQQDIIEQAESQITKKSDKMNKNQKKFANSATHFQQIKVISSESKEAEFTFDF